MVALTNYQAGKFETFTGKEVDILNPTEKMICMEDISHGLANICRFGGHLNRHYSVAMHTLLVMDLAPVHLKQAALLHDASEAYLGDVIKPVKHILGKVYADLETNWTNVICSKFCVDPELLRLIKPYDIVALELEYKHIKKGLPSDAMRKFLYQFRFMDTYSIGGKFHAIFNTLFYL